MYCKPKFFLICIAVLMGLSACTKFYDCLNPGVFFHFSGFGDADLSVVYFTSYEKGANFRGVSHKIISGKSITANTADSVALDKMLAVDPSYDWEVTIPSSGKVYRVSDINFEKETQTLRFLDMVRENCSNGVKYILNGTSMYGRGTAGDYIGSVYIDLKN